MHTNLSGIRSTHIIEIVGKFGLASLIMKTLNVLNKKNNEIMDFHSKQKTVWLIVYISCKH